MEPVATDSPGGPAPACTVVVEVLDDRGRVRARERIVLDEERRRFTAGRSMDADIVLDDPYAAALHAQFELSADGRLRVTDLDSVNGLVLDGRRVHRARNLELRDGLVQAGRTTLRIRLPGEPLAPERPDHAGRAGRKVRGLALAGAVFCTLFVFYQSWVDAPRDPLAAAAAALSGAVFFAAGWVAIWSLLSRVLQSEWRIQAHSAVFLCVVAGLLVADLAIDLAWFAFALPPWPLRNVLLAIVAGAVALYWHLGYAFSLRARTAAVWAIVLPALIGGSGAWVQARNQAHNVNLIGEREELFPYAFRLRAGESTEACFNAAALLREAADRRMREMPKDDVDDSD